MKRYLLDTSVLSQPLRRRPLDPVMRRWGAVGDKACCTSVVCHAEIEWGLRRESRPARMHKFEALLRNRPDVLPTDSAVWLRFSCAKARQAQLGLPVADLDLLIAATALEHELTLATLNARHFSLVEGLRWEDWGK